MRIQLPNQRVMDVSAGPTPLATGGALDKKAAPPVDQGKADPWVSHLVNVAERVYKESLARQCPKDLGDFLAQQGCTNIEWFDGWITQAVGYVKGGHRCLVFRGTQETQDWVTDALCFYYGSPPRHFGFHCGWANVRTKALHWLQSTESSSSGVFLAGHSLGAAIAVVAALDLAKQKTEKEIRVERVVLFGCPRVGPFEFWKRYDEAGLNQKTERFEHEDDGVCVIPPPVLFMHVGRASYAGPPFVRAQPFVKPPFVAPRAGVGPVSAKAEAANLLQPGSPSEAVVLNLMLATLGMVAYLWLFLIQRFPDSLWLNPLKMPSARRKPALAVLLFPLVPIAAHLLFRVGPVSSRFVAEIHKSSLLSLLLFLITTVLEAFVVQQACYFVLMRIPTLPRLLLSILMAGLVFWFFPVRQIEAVVVPALALLVVVTLPVFYRAVGGSPAHLIRYYVDALSERATQKSASLEPAPEVSPDMAKLFLMMERIARDPKSSGYLDQAFAKIRSGKP